MKVKSKKGKIVRGSIWIVFILFSLMNIVANFHAYKFTHFNSDITNKTTDPKKMTGLMKVKTLFFGVNNPRPQNEYLPSQPFETITISSNKKIECWSIPQESSKGTVVIFHGYSGNKSSILDKSDEFLKLGYSTFLVDFMGSGGSEGNQTTIGFKEAEQVKSVVEYLESKSEANIILCGTSMGAVDIMKAIDEYKIKPNKIILECPFGSMYETVCARFKTMNAPTFPMAGMLVFWGGVQNGFWAFGHKPTEYAKSIDCPVLLLYGEKDEKVSRKEIDEIYVNISSVKKLITFPDAAHENYLNQYSSEWIVGVTSFLNK